MTDHPAHRRRLRAVIPFVAVLAAGGLAACGSSGEDLDLSEAGRRGHELTRSNGCVACHGSNGEGGVGPAYVGLFGSEQELQDGTTVVADRDYLRESITDPDAKRVAGYGINMPANNLSPDEVDAVVEYIVELAAAEDGS